MIPTIFDLPLIWAGLLVLAVFLYILLDGFDLGIGILFPFVATDAHRDQMIVAIAPVWDGNQTWLVFGGVGLFAAFPKAFAIMMPALYMPVGFMITALIFRGVAFEFRSGKGAGRRLWNHAFHLGSVAAAFAQGLILGALVQGIHVEKGHFTGGMFDWLTPFSFTTGWALVWGYVLLGSTWLIIKTEGKLLAWAQRAAFVAGIMILLMMAIISLWMLFLDIPAATRWGLNSPLPHLVIQWDRLLSLIPVPVLVGICGAGFFNALRKSATYKPYLWSISLFMLGYAGLLYGIWPYLVPYAVTIREAAASHTAQGFLLIGTLVLLPLILAYTAYVYWNFRGKVEQSNGGD